MFLAALLLVPSFAEAAPNCASSVEEARTWLPIHATELNAEVKDMREIISEAKGDLISGRRATALHQLGVLDAQAKVLESIAQQIELAASALTSACVATTSTTTDVKPALESTAGVSGR